MSHTRKIEEVEVESVAYIVCDAIGLDTSDVEKIRETGKRVVECAKTIFMGLGDEAWTASSAGS